MMYIISKSVQQEELTLDNNSSSWLSIPDIYNFSSSSSGSLW